MTEAQRKELLAMRAALDGLVGKIVETPAEVNEYQAAVREWQPGAFAVGDVRQRLGAPYKCVQAHDSTANPSWTPEATPALWMQYHGTTPESARPWIAPTGEHDMYKAGEYMIWTDGRVKKAKMDTAYSPTDYPQAWEDQSGGETGGETGGGGGGESGGGTTAAPWKQPEGAHDAYNKGAEVSHNGFEWTSDVDGNVWEPGVHGWTKKES